MTIIEMIHDDERKRRVIIFQRADGTFGFEEQRFSAHEFEQCWVPFGRYSISFCDTFETALGEAKTRIDWLIGLRREIEMSPRTGHCIRSGGMDPSQAQDDETGSEPGGPKRDDETGSEPGLRRVNWINADH